MIELGSLDDMGQGYDLASGKQDRVACMVGRHTSDHVTSFYAHTPSGFLVEYGGGGRVIDPDTWTPHETFDGPSSWGTSACTCRRSNAPGCARCGWTRHAGACGRRCRPRSAPGPTP